MLYCNPQLAELKNNLLYTWRLFFFFIYKGGCKHMAGFIFAKIKSIIEQVTAKKEIEIPTTEIKKTQINHMELKEEIKGTPIEMELLDLHPNVYLVNKATRLCIGRDELDTYENRLKHIQKCMKRGHESVLEHSNVVGMLRINKLYLAQEGLGMVQEITDFLTNTRYLHVVQSETADYFCFLIGGSIRGYIHVMREWVSSNNQLYPVFKTFVEQSIEKEFLVELIENGILEEEDCTYLALTELVKEPYTNEDGETDYEEVAKPMKDPKVIEYPSTPNVSLLYAQNVLKIYNKVSAYSFCIRDVYQVCTITFLFHDVSRAIGNQLVRHRVGITQESQRYCEHNTDRNKDFVDPILLHRSGKSINSNRYSDESGFDMRVETEYLKKRNPFTVYKYLIEHGVMKEDARAWLPMNVTTKLIMTFTYAQFAKFYELRSSPGAQYEIQLLADQCRMHICNLPDNIFFGYGSIFESFIVDALLSNAYRASGQHEERLEVIENEYNKFLDTARKEIKIDEEDNNISTEVEEYETPTKPEDIKALNINSIEDAEAYLKMNEDMKKL